MLGQVIKGFPAASPLAPTHAALLYRVLLPLHRVNEMYEWRDQIPLIQVSDKWTHREKKCRPLFFLLFLGVIFFVFFGGACKWVGS